jgi:hypothetical protein
MCVVSNIGDYYGQRYREWPRIDPFRMPDQLPTPSIPPQDPKDLAEQMRKFMELVKKGEEADKAMGEKDCEKGEVKKFIKQVGERLAAIEKRLRQIEGLE